MLFLSSLTASALLVGSPMRVTSARIGSPPVMEGIGQAFSEALSGLLPKPAALPVIDVKGPSPVLGVAGKGMSLLGPVFNIEAVLQALATNLGSYDEEEVQADIAETISSAPVVIYTYALSPFSTEALSVLESTGCKFENVQLGLEWFALGPKGSATRVEMRKLYGQGSLPHVFIGGEWVGGLATGGEGGLTGLVERDELVGKLRKARAL